MEYETKLRMNSMRLAGAVLVLGASAGAQSHAGKVFARYQRPLQAVTLDVSTGTITRGPALSERASPTVVDFHNIDLGGFVGVDTGAGFCEWFDAGLKGSSRGSGPKDPRTCLPGISGCPGFIDSGNTSDLMTSIVFAYCSAKAAVGSGGPGGSVRLGFYEGYTVFGGAPTTNVASFTLTGLPANSASSSFFGGFNCFFIRVAFGTLVCFADGPIGYSWRFLDVGTGTLNPIGAVLAGTWPFLACVASCSGNLLGFDGQGMTDVVDQYCPPGTLRASFTFGTTSGSFTSFSMAIEESVDKTSAVVPENATPPNDAPDILAADAATVGCPWSASLTLGIGRTKAGSVIAFFGNGRVGGSEGVVLAPTGSIPPFHLGTAKGGKGRRLFCNGSLGVLGGVPAQPHAGATGQVVPIPAAPAPIPKQLCLVCFEWCMQALVTGSVPIALGGGNARLSSVVNGTIGNQKP
jgi:hypothetical protein